MEIEKIIAEVIKDTDYEIIDLVIRGEKRTKVLELYLDRKDSVNIDELAEISRKLESVIEENQLAGDISKIVVSSPGVDRPFKYIWQLDKHMGRTLDIVMNDGTDLSGRLDEVNDETGVLTLSVKPNAKKSEEFEAPVKFSDIKEAKVKISFSKK